MYIKYMVFRIKSQLQQYLSSFISTSHCLKVSEDNKHQIVVQLKDIPCSTMPEKKERSNSKK